MTNMCFNKIKETLLDGVSILIVFKHMMYLKTLFLEMHRLESTHQR